MEVTHLTERTTQIMTVPMHLSTDSRLQIVSKLTPASVGIHTEEDEEDIMGTHYIPVNVQRVSDTLSSKILTGDPLHSDLLTHQVVDLAGADFVQHTVPTHYYDAEDILSQEDLTEDDRRLAAALVAVQFVQQQKQQQQTTVLTTDLLGQKPMVTLPNVTTIDKPMAGMVPVSSYMQAVQEEAVHQQLMDHHNQERMIKMYQSSSQDLKLHPLPPLKKVLSSQSMMMPNKYNTDHEELPPDMSQVSLPEEKPLNEIMVSKPEKRQLSENEKEAMRWYKKSARRPVTEQDMGTVIQDMGSSSKSLEDLDSDYDVESRPSHRSLPHKKRIPRKLKAPPARSVHTKCYKCTKCGETFTSQSAFSAHRTSHSSPGNTKRPSNSYSCELCSKQFTSQLKFFEHLKAHYEPGGSSRELVIPDSRPQTADTPTIQDSFSIKTEFQPVRNVELKECGESVVGLPCSVCGKVFRRQKALESHMSVSHPRDHEIEEFSEPEDMMEGIRDVVNIGSGDEDHSDEKMRQWRYSELGMDVCVVPAEESSNGSSSGKHGKKQLQCPHCERSFNHRNSLLYHVRSHSGQRPHQCEVCGKSFLAASALKVHMRLHSGDKPYKCDYCGKTFRQWGDLKYHVTSLHSDTKQFQCEYCGKDFARKYSLIVHRRIHTGEKNYTCEFCNKTFRASSYLQNHRRIHTGEKPHACDVCGKPFRVRSDMKRHRTTHSGEKRRSHAPPPQESLSDVEAESILPDCSPLNLNVRSNDSDETLVYRDCMERETVFLWIPNTQQTILSDE